MNSHKINNILDYLSSNGMSPGDFFVELLEDHTIHRAAGIWTQQACFWNLRKTTSRIELAFHREDGSPFEALPDEDAS
jgi:hypothetical protein